MKLEKLHIELKWACYFAIANAIFIILLIVLMLVFHLFSLDIYSVFMAGYQNAADVLTGLAVFYIIQLFYFSSKAITEYKKHTMITLNYQLDVFFWVCSISLVLQSFLFSANNTLFYFDKIKRNLSEFLIDDDSKNYFKD